MKGNEEISIIMKLEPSAAHHKNKNNKDNLGSDGGFPKSGNEQKDQCIRDRTDRDG